MYLAKIQADSMQGAGIFSGHLVVVDRNKTARHGDNVVRVLSLQLKSMRRRLKFLLLTVVSRRGFHEAVLNPRPQ